MSWSAASGLTVAMADAPRAKPFTRLIVVKEGESVSNRPRRELRKLAYSLQMCRRRPGASVRCHAIAFSVPQSDIALDVVERVIRDMGAMMRQTEGLPEDIPTLSEVERRHILQTLARCGYNRTHAAKLLGLSIRCLRTKLHQYRSSDLLDEPLPARPHDP
jgi:DNA-binding NtrC family response regulator